MSIERERKFMVSVDEARQLADGLTPRHITQHYLSQIATPQELRIRRVAGSAFTPKHLTTLKQGQGEYRQETETSLLEASYLSLSALSLGVVRKQRYSLDHPGLTLDTYRSGAARLFGLLEIEQTADAPDIGLFDPRALGLANPTEVTGLPDFTNRNLAIQTERKERAMPPAANLEQIYDMIEQKRQPKQSTILTLSGPSGSGKTTLLNQFTAKYGSRCTTISTDDYYIGKTLMQTNMPEGHTTNFDHPAAIDTARLARDIQALRAGDSINKPLYDMKHSEPQSITEKVSPRNLIIIEGIAANLPEIRELSDLSLAITAPVDERLRRRMERDVRRKGRSAEQTLDIFMNHVEPSYQTHFAPHDARVDYTLNERSARNDEV